MKKETVKNFLMTLTLVHLSFLRVWNQLSNPQILFFSDPLPNFLDIFILAAQEIFISLFVVSFFTRFRQLSKWLQVIEKIIYIAFFTQFLWGLKQTFTDWKVLESYLFFRSFPLLIQFLTVTIFGILFIFLFLKKNYYFLLPTLKKIFLILSPIILIHFIWAWIYFFLPQTSNLDKTNPPVYTDTKRFHSRIIWMIFDELDESVVFDQRLSKIDLPNLDALKQNSLSASKAYPPANYTPYSMSSYLLRKLVRLTIPTSPFSAILKLRDHTEIPWEGTENLFQKLFNLSRSIEVIGWHIPYCKLYQPWLHTCFHHNSNYFGGRSFIEKTLNPWQISNPFSIRDRALKNYFSTVNKLKDLIRTSYTDFIFVHWPIPHSPGIYDADTKKFRSTIFLKPWYIGNLLLVDKTLGEIRDLLEQEGKWDETTLLVTSDHWYRELPNSDHRIPFLLKMKGQKEGIEYKEEFNTILLHDLLLELAAEKLKNPQEVVEWLNIHRNDFANPTKPNAQNVADIPLHGD
jgi:hypothetical protein